MAPRNSIRRIYSEFLKFHPNPFTSGVVIAERVNIVETRHKVFPILGEASASYSRVKNEKAFLAQWLYTFSKALISSFLHGAQTNEQDGT